MMNSTQAFIGPDISNAAELVREREERKRMNPLYEGHVLLEGAEIVDPAVAERFRILRAKIERLNRDQQRYQTIAITSSLPSEGKSVVSANLSRALSIDPLGKTLLLEGDLRRPSVHNFFQVPQAAGLSDFMEGTAPLEQIIRSAGPGLDIVTAGRPVADAAQVIENPVFARLLDHLKTEYRYIVIDCPPALFCSEPITISTIADGTFGVVRAWHTQKRVVRDMVKAIGKKNFIGLVLNDGLDTSRQYYDYGYYGRSEATNA